MSAADSTSLAEPLWARLIPWARRLEGILLPLMALLVGFLAFAVFLLILGKDPVQFYELVYMAGFGTSFSWQNTLSRAAPLLFAALCVAIPARLGLVVIGGEGAIVLGGVATGGLAVYLAGWPAGIAMPLLAIAAAVVGGFWIGIVGWLRHVRGVNETISSLLMAYIAIALMNHLVEGVLRDPTSLNKPSTAPLVDALRVGTLPGWNVHWGLAVAIVGCILAWVLIEKTTWGFAARIAGGNIRAAEVQGLPVGRLIIGFTALGGAFAGLAGYFEVAAVHGTANASLAAGYGYTGILIAFLARQNPLAIIPVAILLAGIEASSGLVQRRMQLPDATMLVLEGFVFMAILISDTFTGRLNFAALFNRGGRS
ncbi:ABC transporter permease [Acuticoccus kandeliae]|uniref:ABC transporter permease n=1 Tax=Acuticoccus kandeliae TaxID=2073160 RepID=UPI000D3E164C|nr:ABC transporter permease [Acuticoccus kandeliae]